MCTGESGKWIVISSGDHEAIRSFVCTAPVRFQPSSVSPFPSLPFPSLPVSLISSNRYPCLSRCCCFLHTVAAIVSTHPPDYVSLRRRPRSDLCYDGTQRVCDFLLMQPHALTSCFIDGSHSLVFLFFLFFICIHPHRSDLS